MPQDAVSTNSDGLERDVEEVRGGPRDPEAVQKSLERALNYREWVRVLHDSLDVSDEVIAEVAGVVGGSVRRWRSNDPDVGEPRQAQAQAIERLRRIALVLVASGTFHDLRGVGVWLQTGQRNLDWKSPADILSEDLSGGFERVLREAEIFVRPGAGAAGFGGTRP
jgi:hypothetical protein